MDSKETVIYTPEMLATPNVSFHLSAAVLQSMVNESLAHAPQETGGSIFGLRFTSDRKQVLAAISTFTPTASSDIDRHAGHLHIGGLNSQEYFHWLMANWPTTLSQFLAHHQLRLDPDRIAPAILGNWHLHPGSMIDYSPTDDGQFNTHLDQGVPDLLAPIAVLRHRRRFDSSLPPLTHPAATRIVIDARRALDVVFWYRTAADRQTRTLIPNIEPADRYPTLPPFPWYLTHPQLFDRETQALAQHHLEIEFVPLPATASHPAQTWLCLRHPNFPAAYSLKLPLDFDRTRTFTLHQGEPEQPSPQLLGFRLRPDQTIAQALEPALNYLNPSYS